MNLFANAAKRAIHCLLLLMILAGAVSAQSGHCMMEGFVVGESDYPGLNNATVELLGDPNAPALRSVKLSARTDKEGKYSLSEIPHGDYILRVSAPGYVTYRINIYMLSDTTTQLHVNLRKKSAPVKRKK